MERQRMQIYTCTRLCGSLFFSACVSSIALSYNVVIDIRMCKKKLPKYQHRTVRPMERTTRVWRALNCTAATVVVYIRLSRTLVLLCVTLFSYFFFFCLVICFFIAHTKFIIRIVLCCVSTDTISNLILIHRQHVYE